MEGFLSRLAQTRIRILEGHLNALFRQIAADRLGGADDRGTDLKQSRSFSGILSEAFQARDQQGMLPAASTPLAARNALDSCRERRSSEFTSILDALRKTGTVVSARPQHAKSRRPKVVVRRRPVHNL